jgi:hypothetical protein
MDFVLKLTTIRVPSRICFIFRVYRKVAHVVGPLCVKLSHNTDVSTKTSRRVLKDFSFRKMQSTSKE